MSCEEIVFHPIISSIQRIALYETKSKFYLVGTNNTETRFRVLKIDRTTKDLVMVDDKVEYNKYEVQQLINMIGAGNKSAKSGGFTKHTSAFGIMGFVRFLEGYYLMLVTKRSRVAVIGAHSIYKIADTTMKYIPSDTSKPMHCDEQRYLKMFQAVDLTTNFYYSYSYDITHTLQMNLAPPRKLAPALFPEPITSNILDKTPVTNGDCTCGLQTNDSVTDDEDIFETWKTQLRKRDVNSRHRTKLEFGVRAVPEWRFVWNSHLLSPIHSLLHPDWILYVVHGFIEQCNVSVFGRPIYLTLIARRSNRYAGTRFLKRGANFNGDVANEVETEQIVHDSMVSSFIKGRFSSYVQLRGSIPAYWSQDISKMVPKPAISIDKTSPYAEIAAKHINDLLRRYGAPVIFLNLVKKKEKRKHESLLSEEISNSVKYLNQFLPPEHSIQYCHFDMARKNKLSDSDSSVLDKLASIARSAVKRTGVFVCGRTYGETNMGVEGHQGGKLQTGILRVNCVDCLDRTNTTQFAIGKCVLGYQLHELGVLAKPVLEFDCDCIRLLEGLYEDHGDTLALQYGGSQLVHRIKTYRKTARWASHGNDIMQTLSRYYSNTFSDAEKQNTINLFLGLFVPHPSKKPLWEMPNDYYLHHPEAITYLSNDRSLTQWWDKDVIIHLPRSANEMRKLCCEVIGVGGEYVEMLDPFMDYNRPHEYSNLSESFEFEMCNTFRDLTPVLTMNPSPFVVRGHGKNMPTSKNPVITGRASTASNNSSDSSSDSSSEDELSCSNPSTRQVSPSPQVANKAFNTNEAYNEDYLNNKCPAVVRTKRILLRDPSRRDMLVYKRYVNFDRKSKKITDPMEAVNLTVCSALSIDSSTEVIPPTVSKASKEIYKLYVNRTNGAKMPSDATILQYAKYVNFSLCHF